jgi:hypothetical protein
MIPIDFYRPEIARWYAANSISIFAGLSRVEATYDEEKVLENSQRTFENRACDGMYQ